MKYKTPIRFRETDDDFALHLEALTLLRKLFLSMPYEDFVNIYKLRENFSKQLTSYFMYLSSYLDYDVDSYKYFMLYLEDAQTFEVCESYKDHDIHTDMWGRIALRKNHDALGYAMGFKCFTSDLDVAKYGYEKDLGYVEEMITIDSHNYKISGHKNNRGNYHGYCEILEEDETLQSCFFDDGKIKTRKIYYQNGLTKEVSEHDDIIIDHFAPRTVYELYDAQDCDNQNDVVISNDEIVIKKMIVSRDVVEMLFHTLSQYCLKMEYKHFVQYPYDEGEWEVDKMERIPSIDMALFHNKELVGIVFKTNGRRILSLDTYGGLNRSWDVFPLFIDDEVTIDEYKFSLRKKDVK